MNHHAEDFFVTADAAVLEPRRIKGLYRAYLREKVSVSAAFFLFGAAVLAVAVLGDTGGNAGLLYAAAAGLLAVSALFYWLRRTDPVTAFLNDPPAFACCRAEISQALFVPGSRHSPAYLRVFAVYAPAPAPAVMLEANFDPNHWPFAYEKDGVLHTCTARAGQPAHPLPAACWVAYQTSSPAVSFIAAIRDPVSGRH